MVHLTVIEGEERQGNLNEAVHHALQCRRVSTEGHWSEQHGHVALHDGPRDPASRIVLHAYARRLGPAAETANAVRQPLLMQADRLDARAICAEHAAKDMKDWLQVGIVNAGTVKNDNVLSWHPGFSRRAEESPARHKGAQR